MSNEEKKGILEKSPAALREEKILAFWQESNIFDKTLAKEAPKGEFVFFEGPPTANGRPGIHHLEARAFKDLIPRYKTMQGYHVARRGGWDTHGLPVELQVEKELGLNSKKDIEKYGIDKFNQKCKESVWTYVDEWKKFTERIGYWLDLKNPYVTYETCYIEAVWRILKSVHAQNLLYKDYRIVPWCSRCGTALSSHELAQGYKDVKDISVYVKFKVVGEENTYLIAWTTTPWTLPGNTALAVGKEIDYVKAKIGEDTLIVAKERLKVLGEDVDVLEELKGSDLLDLSYEPIYPYLKETKNAFKVYEADFVTTTDGSGIVHIAPMYGTDDFELATKLSLPKFHVVKDDGTFIPEVEFLAGSFVKDEQTTISIIKDLHARNILFKKESVTHTYPHCWRCDTPLIYFARDSWYIRMSSLRENLMAENQGINWEPSYIKNGRFGEWLKEVKDWAISRERYWGTPLPIWRSEDGLDIEVIGGVDDLKKYLKPRNRYIVMRHGEGEHNKLNVTSSDHHMKYHLTEKGREDVALVAHTLQDEDIDIVYVSPLTRTKETAEIVVETIAFKGEVIEDNRLREYEFGDLDDKLFEEYHRYFNSVGEQLDKRLPNGENIRDVVSRIGEFIHEIDAKHENKTILIVTHDAPASMLFAIAEGGDDQTLVNLWAGDFLEPGHMKELCFTSMPRNKSYALDLHRPYIDNFTFEKDGKKFKRVPEVLDVWFDSGAMPFAAQNSNYPADFISEAIDQTRGWFYTLHAIGTLMGRGKAYKNVICLGHILDKNGQKMSKSRGNGVNPWEMMDIYGADALRFWMYSVNQPGESKNFDIETVDGVVKKVFNLLLNTVTFYELYNDQAKELTNEESANVMDRWIMSLLAQLQKTVESSLDEYKVLEASRAIKDFIADFSQWYIRNSRERFKSDIEKDRNEAIGTTKTVLLELSKIMAPFTPFLSEDIYKRVGGELESVHLENWPKSRSIDQDLLGNMVLVRSFVTQGLELRMKAGIKVRQPLALFVVGTDIDLSTELLQIVAKELNVAEVKRGEKNELDTNITPELKMEGEMRELVRMIQDKRKEENWQIADKGNLILYGTAETESMLLRYEAEIKKTAGLSDIDFREAPTIKIELQKA